MVVEYLTRCLGIRSPNYEETISSYIAKFVKKAKSQMKAHSIDPKDPVSFIEILVAFKLGWNVTQILQRRGNVMDTAKSQQNAGERTQQSTVRSSEVSPDCRLNLQQWHSIPFYRIRKW